MSEDMHGARRNHEIYGVSLVLALQVEEAEEQGEAIAGMSLDKKFFDLLEYELLVCGERWVFLKSM